MQRELGVKACKGCDTTEPAKKMSWTRENHRVSTQLVSCPPTRQATGPETSPTPGKQMKVSSSVSVIT